MRRATAVLWIMLATLSVTGCVALAVGSAGHGDAAGSAGAVATTDDDSMISANVRSRLYRSTVVDAGRVAVTTSGGVVTLSGAVASTAEREHAETLTAGTPGVASIINKLEIKP